VTSGDIPICGYREEALGVCRTARMTRPDGRLAKRCEKHDLPRYAVCTGCAGEAIGECGAGLRNGQGCTAPVCENCRHLPEDDTHGNAPPGAFAGQRPGPKPADLARAGMIEALATALEDLDQRHYIKINPALDDGAQRVAGVLVDELATHVLVQTVGGIISGQVNS
jgi:hypothetical protein